MDFERRMRNNDKQLETLSTAIGQLMETLGTLNKSLHSVERAIPSTTDTAEAAALVENMKQLRAEKIYLLKREEQLRHEAAQVRDESIYLLKHLDQQQAAKAAEPATTANTLRELLLLSMSPVDIQDCVVQRMRQRFPEQVALLLIERNAGFARDIYQQTLALPQTDTELYLQQQGIVPAQRVFVNNEALLAAYRGTKPLVIKMLQSQQYHRLLELNEVLQHHQHQQQRIISFELHSAGSALMMIMPRLTCPLSDLPRPIGTEASSIIYRDLSTALSFLHAKGYAHMDIKASNALISEHGAVALADLNSVCKLGDYALRTPSCLPSDYPGKHAYSAYSHSRSATAGSVLATERADWWMLAALLLTANTTEEVGERRERSGAEVTDMLIKLLPEEIAQDLLVKMNKE